MEVARAPYATPASWAEPTSRMQTNMQTNSVSPPTSGRSIPSLSELMHRASESPSLGGGAGSRPGEKSYSEPSTPALFNSPGSKSDQAKFTRIPLSQLMASSANPDRHGEAHHPIQLSPSTSTASVPSVSPSQQSGRIPPSAQSAGAHPMARQDSSQPYPPTFHSPVIDSFVQVPFNSSSIPKTASLGHDAHMNGAVQRTVQQTGAPGPRASVGSYSSLPRSPRAHPLPIREYQDQRSASLGSVPSHPHQSIETMPAGAPTFVQTHTTSPTEMQRDLPETSLTGQKAMAANSPDVEQEIRRLTDVVNTTSPLALHAVLRKFWRPFIFQQATDDHTSFVLRAGLQNASPKVMERVVRDKSFPSQNIIPFLPKKQSVIDMCLAGATPQMIQDNVSADVLDDVLFTRMTVMPARKLATMLAEAGRLGFTLDDLVDEEDDTVLPAPPKIPSRHAATTQMSGVQPSVPPQSSQHPTQGPSHIPTLSGLQSAPYQHQQQPYNNVAYAREGPTPSELTPSAAGARQNPSASLYCGNCKQKLPSLSGYNYHISKNVCEKGIPYDAKWSCHNCLKYFTTKQGQTYHQMKRVCYGLDIEPATAPSEQPVPAVQHPSVPSQPAAASFPPQPVSSAYAPRAELPRYHAPAEPELPARQANIQPISQSRKSPASTPPPASNRLYPSELPPEQLNELNAEIDAIQRQYERAVANIPATLTPQEREQKLTSLKNSYNTRKSVARKKHGVSLRKRVEPTYRVTPPPKNELVQSFRALPPLTSAPPKAAPYATPTTAQAPAQTTSGFNAINHNHSSGGSASRSTVPEIRPPNWEFEMNHLGQRLNQSIKRTMDSSPDSPPATVQRTAAVTRPSMVMNDHEQHDRELQGRSMASAPNREESRLIDLTADSSTEAEKLNKDRDSSTDDDEDLPAIPRRRMSDNSAQRSQPMVVLDPASKRHDSYPSTFVRASSVDNQGSPRRREKGKQYAIRGGRRSSYADRGSQRPSTSGSAF
ncbi:hypothetical protein F5884DRAFT_857683 [Xylogone sp. PMI_703]|nr:hypothetical protein F5884DRAFT_857683 [Xylogone sp. PMI_703]